MQYTKTGLPRKPKRPTKPTEPKKNINIQEGVHDGSDILYLAKHYNIAPETIDLHSSRGGWVEAWFVCKDPDYDKKLAHYQQCLDDWEAREAVYQEELVAYNSHPEILEKTRKALERKQQAAERQAKKLAKESALLKSETERIKKELKYLDTTATDSANTPR